MKFKVYIGGGSGNKEVEAEDDILAVMPCVTMREYLEQVGRGKRGAAHDI